VVSTVDIRQDTLIEHAAPDAVYDVLTDGARFAAATGLPACITDRAGEPFTAFGGRIEGRQIELVPGRRVVQAWRFGREHPSPWPEGVYSLVSFSLAAVRGGTSLVIEHTAVPAQWRDHIAGGYPAFYEQPLQRYFAS
jgi:activator of HSP90 ATPase